MNRWFSISLMVLTLVLGAATFASAACGPNDPTCPQPREYENFIGSSGAPLPLDASEKSVYYALWQSDWEPNSEPVWEELTFTRVAEDAESRAVAPARSWNSGGDWQAWTKQQYTGFNFTQHASVAQWVSWTINDTRKDWRVRQPGIYYSDGFKFNVKSNNEIGVFFSGFGDLEDRGSQANPQDTIEVWYSLNAGEAPTEWFRAAALNEMNPVIPNTEALHYQGEDYIFWTAIQVEPGNNSSEYRDEGCVTIGLRNMKAWINPVKGSFATNQLANPQY